ncbi:MAG: tRNA threonylcarbamoyladenosine dehydratase, partial [Lentimicrobiaceae bacterium]|nr:tRNA threonylcarbamoyladenosine dehydratase [Lentimicrobiaceae bacterium]
GAYAAEMLCRAGIPMLTLIDADVVDCTNRNRQLPALISTQGRLKTEVMRERLLDINPELKVVILSEFLRDERIAEVLEMDKYDYIIDAIDSLSPKAFLIAEALKRNIPIVSAMGAGGKIDPSKVQVADISKTHQCHLASYMRKRLRKMGITKGFKAVFSTEEQMPNSDREDSASEFKRTTVGTISYMPAVFGCWCASVCIRELVELEFS